MRSDDPGGGGADTTCRKRQDRSELQQLSNTVCKFPPAVASLRIRRKEMKGNKSAPRRAQLESMCQAARSRSATPNDEDVEAKLARCSLTNGQTANVDADSPDSFLAMARSSRSTAKPAEMMTRKNFACKDQWKLVACRAVHCDSCTAPVADLVGPPDQPGDVKNWVAASRSCSSHGSRISDHEGDTSMRRPAR